MTREFALDPKSKRSTLRLFRQMVPPEFFNGFDSMIARIVAAVPTRIVWGRGDPYIPERYANGFPGAHLTVKEQAGHWVPISSANEVASAVQALASQPRA